MAQLAQAQAGTQGALRSFNMTSEDPAACPALLCKSRPAAIAACNAYRVSALYISLPHVVIKYTVIVVHASTGNCSWLVDSPCHGSVCLCPTIMCDGCRVHLWHAP